MFLSEFNHTIDEKGRLTLPAKYRAELATGVIVTRGLEPCLFIYPKEEWEKLAARINAMSPMKHDVRAFSRFIFAGANDCLPDKQGRILLPSYLREYANLDGEVVIIGAGTRLEVWNPANWQKIIREVELDADQTAERLADLGLL